MSEKTRVGTRETGGPRTEFRARRSFGPLAAQMPLKCESRLLKEPGIWTMVVAEWQEKLSC